MPGPRLHPKMSESPVGLDRWKGDGAGRSMRKPPGTSGVYRMGFKAMLVDGLPGHFTFGGGISSKWSLATSSHSCFAIRISCRASSGVSPLAEHLRRSGTTLIH